MRHVRTIFGFIIIIILISSMIYSFKNYEKNNPQTIKYNQIFQDPTLYINSHVSFKAEMLSINPENQTIRIFIQEKPYTYPQVTINIHNTSAPNLQKGDLVDIIAIVQGKTTMTATHLWINEPWKDNLIYLRSLPAIPFLLYLFFRTWTFNKQTWRFERRKKNA
jgi:hypothetical protein